MMISPPLFTVYLVVESNTVAEQGPFPTPQEAQQTATSFLARLRRAGQEQVENAERVGPKNVTTSANSRPCWGLAWF